MTRRSVSASRPAVGLSFGALCGALSLWAIALRVLLVPIPPHDFWWHMAQGRAIAQAGRVPTVDSFSYTRAGEPFFDQSWLAQWSFFALHTMGGIPLLIVAQTLLVVLVYALLWLMARDRGEESATEIAAQIPHGARERASRIASLVLLGVTLVSFDNWLLRPQTFVIPLFACWLWTLEKWRRQTISPAAFIAAQAALMILWANSHGSFPLALLLNGATLLGSALDARRQKSPFDAHLLIASSVASILAIGANPRGLQVLAYVRMMLFDPSNKFSAEWLSPTPRNLGDALFFGFALSFFLVLAHASRRPSFADSARMAVFFWLAITSGRYILWFAIVAALPLASAFTSSSGSRDSGSDSSESTRRGMNAVVAVFMWLGLVPLLPWLKPSLGLGAPLGSLLSDETPVRAVQVLEARPPRRLWHNAPCGSYLSWAAPKVKVWIDTRFELYPPEQWRDYARAAGGEAQVLERDKCDAALVDVRLEGALDRELGRRGWRQEWRDARFAVWRRPGIEARP